MKTKKVCPRCRKEKDAVEFGCRTDRPDQLNTYCKPCAVEKTAAWNKLNPDRVKLQDSRKYEKVMADPDKRATRNRLWKENHKRLLADPIKGPLERERQRLASIKSKYQLSDEKVEWIRMHCRDLCPVCGLDPARKKPGILVVDHDHQTGKFRGLICHGCNAVLGIVEEDRSRLFKLADYLPH